MIIRDPCKKCIVQPMCKVQCTQRVYYAKTINTFTNVSSGLISCLVGYILAVIFMGNDVDGNILFITGCFICILISTFNFYLIRKYKCILIQNNKRFPPRVIKISGIKSIQLPNYKPPILIKKLKGPIR